MIGAGAVKVDTSQLRKFERGLARALKEMPDLRAEIYCVNTHPRRLPSDRTGRRPTARSGASRPGPAAFARQWALRARAKSRRARNPYLPRTGAENAEIYERQAAQGRDPLFASGKESKLYVSMIEAAVAKFLDSAGFDYGYVKDAVSRVGKEFADNVKEHIEAGKSEHGRMRRLTDRTRKYKRKYFHRARILERTGQLMDSIRARVTHG